MKKRILSLLLAAALAVSVLALPALAAGEGEAPGAGAAPQAATEQQPVSEPAPAQAEPEEHRFTYVALGDSITAGVGLAGVGFPYRPDGGLEMSGNFTGYTANCYVAVVAEMLGLDRTQALNYGLPGIMAGDLAELVEAGAMSQPNQVSGTYFAYPQILDDIRRADVVSIQVGANDATVPFTISLSRATNGKMQKFMDELVWGGFRELNFETLGRLWEMVNKFAPTSEEWSALFYAMGDGMRETCNHAYGTVTQSLPRIIAAVRALNPDAQILLLGYYDPMPLIPCWHRLFTNLNTYAQELAAQQGVTYVSILNTRTASDAHPTIDGHRFMASQIVSAIQ